MVMRPLISNVSACHKHLFVCPPVCSYPPLSYLKGLLLMQTFFLFTACCDYAFLLFPPSFSSCTLLCFAPAPLSFRFYPLFYFVSIPCFVSFLSLFAFVTIPCFPRFYWSSLISSVYTKHYRCQMQPFFDLLAVKCVAFRPLIIFFHLPFKAHQEPVLSQNENTLLSFSNT